MRNHSDGMTKLRPYTVLGTKKGSLPLQVERRKNHSVVTIRNVRGDIALLCSDLQSALGAGGCVQGKGNDAYVELQGDCLKRVTEFLQGKDCFKGVRKDDDGKCETKGAAVPCPSPMPAAAPTPPGDPCLARAFPQIPDPPKKLRDLSGKRRAAASSSEYGRFVAMMKGWPYWAHDYGELPDRWLERLELGQLLGCSELESTEQTDVASGPAALHTALDLPVLNAGLHAAGLLSIKVEGQNRAERLAQSRAKASAERRALPARPTGWDLPSTAARFASAPAHPVQRAVNHDKPSHPAAVTRRRPTAQPTAASTGSSRPTRKFSGAWGALDGESGSESEGRESDDGDAPEERSSRPIVLNLRRSVERGVVVVRNRRAAAGRADEPAANVLPHLEYQLPDLSEEEALQLALSMSGEESSAAGLNIELSEEQALELALQLSSERRSSAQSDNEVDGDAQLRAVRELSRADGGGGRHARSESPPAAAASQYGRPCDAASRALRPQSELSAAAACHECGQARQGHWDELCSYGHM